MCFMAGMLNGFFWLGFYTVLSVDIKINIAFFFRFIRIIVFIFFTLNDKLTFFYVEYNVLFDTTNNSEIKLLEFF